MVDPQTAYALAALGGIAFAVALLALLVSRRDSEANADADGDVPDAGSTDWETRTWEMAPPFADVCLAAARAKADHDGGDHPAVDREFVDGVDAVLGKLLEAGYGDTDLGMRMAYLTGGDTVEYDPEELTTEDLEALAGRIGEDLPDGTWREV